MENKNQKLILDGNSFYEIDMECLKVKRKTEQKEEQNKENNQRKRQRN